MIGALPSGYPVDDHGHHVGWQAVLAPAITDRLRVLVVVDLDGRLIAEEILHPS